MLCDAYLRGVSEVEKVREGRAGTIVYFPEFLASIREQPGLAFFTAGEGSL